MNNKLNNMINDFLANTDAKDENELNEKLQEFIKKYNAGEIDYENTILDEAYELLEKAGFTDAHVSVEQTDNRIILNIETETPELLIGKSAQTLDALQYVFDKMINLPEDSEISLIVDVGFYRKRRVEENVAKALAMAEKVKRSGRPFKLAPMSSILRKEIHIALKNVPGISTISTGEGPLKQVSIVSDKPRNNRGRFNNRRNNNRYNHREEN